MDRYGEVTFDCEKGVAPKQLCKTTAHAAILQKIDAVEHEENPRLTASWKSTYPFSNSDD
jgi:hypothetical protein